MNYRNEIIGKVFKPEYKKSDIGTDIHYNPLNNIVAVGGCYWACPSDTFLLKVNNPLDGFIEYVSIHSILEYGFDKYDDIDFIKLKCFNNIIEKDEIIILKEEEYKTKMIKI